MNEPYCLAMVLCDKVHRDPSTNKCTILGTFGTFASSEFPGPLKLDIYFALTDGFGEHNLKLKVVNADQIAVDGPPIFEADGKFKSPNPLMVLETALHLEFDIPEPGVYHFEMYVNGIVLMSRKLVAHEIPKGGQGET